MKRIYDFSRKPAARNYTVSDLQALKGTGRKLSMAILPVLMKSAPAKRPALISLWLAWIRSRMSAPSHQPISPGLD